MAIRSSIISSVNNAFNLIGDLGEDVTFTNSTATTYDFNSGNTISPTFDTVTIKGIVSRQYKDITDNPRLLADITLKTEDTSAQDLDNYDTLIFRSSEWKINSVSDNGFITTVTVAKEI